MADFTPTKEQSKAIGLRNKNIILSAQAGAGKTAVLVDRILKIMLEEKKSLDHFLIVTFTKKAANEMKLKIRKALYKKLEEERADRAWYLSQIGMVNHANIQTMHAFCLEMIQDHFELLQKDPGLKIMDSSSLKYLQEEALNDVLRNAYESKEEKVLSFIERFSRPDRRGDGPLLRVISDLSREMDKKINAEEWLKEQVEYIASSSYLDETKSFWMQYMIKEPLEDFQRKLDKIERLVCKGASPQVLEDFILEETQGLRFSIDQDFLGQAFEFRRLPTITKKKYSIEEVIAKDQIKDLRNQIKEDYKELEQSYSMLNQERLEFEQKLMEEDFSILVSLTLSYRKLYRQKKQEENGMDYVDVEHDMLDLLKNPSLVQQLQSKYQYIFFDEYQDANNIQNAIVEKLAGKDNLFFVGDVKQSIYGFRQAEPKNFLARYKAYQADCNSEALDLTANFRSKPVILHFTNFLFTKIMTMNRTDIDYDSPSHLANPKAKDEKKESRVEFCFLEEDRKEEITSHWDEISSQAYYVAAKIRKHVENGGKYRDCAILFRTKHRIFQYERLLNAMRIPSYSDSQTIDFEALEVDLFLDLLSHIDNGSRDLPLIACLLSHVGNFTDEDLAIIRLAHPQGSFYQAFESYEGKDLAEKKKAFEKKILRWRTWKEEMPFSDFIWKLLEDSAFLSFYSSMDDGATRRINLLALGKLAHDFSDQDFMNLSSFLQKIDYAATSDDLSSPATLSEEDDVVRLMTIHKSKGLEFPIVFIVELEREFNTFYTREVFSSHDHFGVALKKYYFGDDGTIFEGKSLRHRLIEKAREREERAEAARVLYVGMTRAEDQLYLLAETKNMSKEFLAFEPSNLQFQLDQGKSYKDWIMTCLLADEMIKRLSTGSLIEKMETFQDYFNLAHKEISEYPPISLVFEKGENFRTWKEANDLPKIGQKGEQDFQKILYYQYPNIEKTKRAKKLTVSELSKKNELKEKNQKDWPKLYQVYEKPRSLPRFMEEDRSFQAKEVGSILHEVFQNLSIKDHNLKSIQMEIDSYVKNLLLTKEERKEVDDDLIYAFTLTPLFSRLKKAKSLYREDSFTLQMEDGYMVDGQIDLYFEEDDGFVIVDFKTDMKIDVDRYKRQLAYYQLALEKAFDKPVKEVYLYWVRHKTLSLVKIDFHDIFSFNAMNR